MKQKEAEELAIGILNSRMIAKSLELSETLKRSEMIYRCLRGVAMKKIKNRFLRSVLKLSDNFLRWVVKKLGEKAGALRNERQKIEKALQELSDGQVGLAVELLQENLHIEPLGLWNGSDGFVRESSYNWYMNLINTLKGEGK